jgi:hypothetical protein
MRSTRLSVSEVSAPHCERKKAFDPPVTLEMIRHGLDEFFAWDPETNEPPPW